MTRQITRQHGDFTVTFRDSIRGRVAVVSGPYPYRPGTYAGQVPIARWRDLAHRVGAVAAAKHVILHSRQITRPATAEEIAAWTEENR